MPRIWFDVFHYYGPPGHVDWSDTVRLSIFLVCSECMGLLALVWAFCVLYHHQKNEGRSLDVVSLLLHNDILELLLNLFIIAALLQYNICDQIGVMCHILTCLWWESRMCGVLLQMMVALERILGLRHPSCSAYVFFPRCSIIVYLIVFIVFFLCEFFVPLPRTHFFLMSLQPVFSVTVTSWIITCRKTSIKHHSSNRTQNQDYTVLAFATLTVALCTISVVLYVKCIWSLWLMCLCLLSLRVITDAPLCVLICREKHSQTHTDPSSDPAAAQTEQTV